MQLSEIGHIVECEINRLQTIYDSVDVDSFVTMPNHVHMIILIESGGRTQFGESGGRTQFAPTVSRIIKQWKGVITKQIGFSPWQKSYHDRIIRNEKEYGLIAEYIKRNPETWDKDRFHPVRSRLPTTRMNERMPI